MVKIYSIFIFLFLISCDNKSNNKFSSNEDDEGQRIEIYEDDISVVDFSLILNMKSFTKLSNDILLGSVQRMFIKNNKLYISDSQPKVVCFNIESGAIEFEISKMGKGPGEFLTITDFLIDEEKKILTIYCSKRRRLINYSSLNGKYINEYHINYAPIKIANIDGLNIFYNPFKLIPSNEFNFTLLVSDSENYSITSKFFAYDPVFPNYMYGLGEGFPFFYNSKELFFVKRFENVVYRITDNNIYPVYNIVLPNSAPIEFWEKKPDRFERAQTDYSRSLTDVFKCSNILYFRFTRQERIIFTFFDIDHNRVLSCGILNIEDVSENVPVIFPIKGVYENAFFALVESDILNNLKENNVKLPESLSNLNVSDNPILIFYEPIRQVK